MKSSSADNLIKLAIIGCGAVTEKKHLPALAKSKKVTVNALVDPKEERMAMLGEKFNINNLSTKIDGIETYADIAILAVPHHLHAPIAVSLMERGLHIFVEKPMATTIKEANMMIGTAKQFNRKIGVGLIRRYYSSFEFVNEVLKRGWLGHIYAFDFREGGVYNWPATTDTLFRKDTGGGVLFDTGAHTLDMLLSWLGNYKDVEYIDDSRGGVDANCQLNVALENGIKGVIELSRTRNLRNTCIIKGSKGEIEVGVRPDGPVILKTDKIELMGTPERKDNKVNSVLDLGRLQIENFVDSIINGTEPTVSGESNLETIRMFDSCKRNTNRLSMPWERFSPEFDFSQFDDKKILVLGGTGFIGGRLVEVLAKNTSARMRVLVRDYSRLSNISRYSLDVIYGDITNRAILSKAIQGCDIVFNLTRSKGSKSEQKLVNISAIKALIEESAKYDVKKIVHVSTVSVYGNASEEVLTEKSKSRPPKSDMPSYTKLKGEKTALELSKKLNIPLTVIQPTVVYGPGAPTWTLNAIKMLKTGKIVLLDGGSGLCNAVYVDDVVNALMLAAIENKGIGETLLISGKDPVTWKKFYGAYENMLGIKSAEIISAEEFIKHRKRERKKNNAFSQIIRLIQEEYSGRPLIVQLSPFAKFRGFVRSIVPRQYIEKAKDKLLSIDKLTDSTSTNTNRPIHIFDDSQITFYRSRAQVSIEKARRLIGYEPKYDFEEGMRLTRLWVKWSNIL